MISAVATPAVTNTPLTPRPAFFRRVASKIIARFRPAAPAPSPALRPLLLGTKPPAPYNPLAAIDARRAAAAPPSAEVLPTCMLPVIVVSTTATFHSLASIEDVVAVLKTTPTSPAVDQHLLTPTPIRAPKPTPPHAPRRLAVRPSNPHSLQRLTIPQTIVEPALSARLPLVRDDGCPHTPCLFPKPFRAPRAKKAAPRPAVAALSPMEAILASSSAPAPRPTFGGPRAPILVATRRRDAELQAARRAALAA
jgi:hypothetical protein